LFGEIVRVTDDDDIEENEEKAKEYIKYL